jgi:hypothetical protein
VNERVIEIQKGKDPGIHILHRPLGLFLVIAYKAVWGIVETISGFLIFYSTILIAKELAEDPQDRLINWIIANVHLEPKTVKELGALFIILGVSKIALAIGLWFSSKKTRDIGIAFFLLLGLFGFFTVIVSPTLFHVAVLAGDLLILWYLWKILPKHLRHGYVE